MGGQATRDSTTGATGSGEPSSTTMISTASSPLVSLASNASRVALSFSPRPYVGTTTVTSIIRSAPRKHSGGDGFIRRFA